MTSIKIGSNTIGTNIFLAPMSGCTDLSFRLISREHGAGFCFFEMVDTHSVIHHRRKTFEMLKTCEDDRPIALQLLGNDPRIMCEAAGEILSKVRVSFLDINAACPVKKVAKKRAGSYLLKDGSSLCEMIRTLASSLDVPITVKIRLGHEKESLEDIVGLAGRCEAAGVSAIFVHGRTALQRYSGEVNYGAIRAIKDAVKIPVIGSGNVLSGELAKRMLDRTGCDGILVARGAFGNPWIFKAIEDYLKDGHIRSLPDMSARKAVLKRHLSYIDKHVNCPYNAKVGIMRKVALWYLKSFPHARKIREQISLVKSCEKMIEFIDAV